MKPSLSGAFDWSSVEIGTAVRLSFQHVFTTLGTTLPGRAVVDVITRQGFEYPACPLLNPGGCHIPPDLASTLPESAVETIELQNVLDTGTEVMLIFPSDAKGKGTSPYALLNVPTSKSLFPVLFPDPDVPLPAVPGADYLSRWVRDIILKREYLAASAELVVSALGGVVASLDGADFRVQLGALDSVRVSKLGLATDTLMLGSTTVAFLETIVAKANLLQTAQDAQQVAISALQAALAVSDPAAAAGSEAAVADAVAATAAVGPSLPPATTQALKSGTFQVPTEPVI